MLNRFKTIRLGEVDDSLFQNNVSQFVSQLENKSQLDSVIISDVALSTTPTEVAHTLGRDWVGWHLVNLDSNAVVYSPTSATNKQLFLTLTASASCTVSVLVF